MKRILCAVLMAVFLATPAFAAKLYLKEGGVIQAKRVWREGGKVYVLATRDTMTSFEPCEVDLKRTFVKKPRAAKTVAAVTPQAQTKAAAPNGAAEAQKPADKKAGVYASQPAETSGEVSRKPGAVQRCRRHHQAAEKRDGRETRRIDP